MSKHKESIAALSKSGVSISALMGLSEQAEAHGRYSVECFDSEGNLKWSEEFDNVVTTVGKNLALDTFLAGSAYTVVGPYLGLINWLFRDPLHCAKAYLSETDGSQNAPEYQNGKGA